MGANLSAQIAAEDVGDPIGAGDRFAEVFLGVAWLCSLYAIAMIFCTCTLVDRWRGPNGTRSVGAASVLAALLLSAAWPVVFVYLLLTH